MRDEVDTSIKGETEDKVDEDKATKQEVYR